MRARPRGQADGSAHQSARAAGPFRSRGRARAATAATTTMALLCFLAAAAAVAIDAAAATTTNPPDTSLDTLPVAYYGANWDRSAVNIATLARFQLVVLMQEDGHCWATCCPDRMQGGSQCGPLHTATDIVGCNASCAQHAAQSEIFAAMKASAVSLLPRQTTQLISAACPCLFCLLALTAPLSSGPVCAHTGIPSMRKQFNVLFHDFVKYCLLHRLHFVHRCLKPLHPLLHFFIV